MAVSSTDWLGPASTCITVSALPKETLWTRLTFRVIGAFFMRTAKNFLHHYQRTNIVLAQPSENGLLNVHSIAGICIVAEVSMNDRVRVIVEENPKNRFAGPPIVRTVKRQRRLRITDVALFRVLS